MLYRLNYAHHIQKGDKQNGDTDIYAETAFDCAHADLVSGTPGGTRTPGPLLRRQLLYPPELQARIKTPPRQGRPQKKAFALERVMGIEPTRPAWKAGILPLNYTRISTCPGTVS